MSLEHIVQLTSLPEVEQMRQFIQWSIDSSIRSIVISFLFIVSVISIFVFTKREYTKRNLEIYEIHNSIVAILSTLLALSIIALLVFILNIFELTDIYNNPSVWYAHVTHALIK